MDEPDDCDSCGRTGSGVSGASGAVGGGSGPGSDLTGTDRRTWGRLSRFEWLRGLVIDVGKLIERFVVVLRLRLGSDGTQGRRGRRGEETIGDTGDPIVLGMDGEADVSIGFDEIVNG